MNPVLKSYLTSLAVAGAGAAVSWAVSKGIVPDADQNAVVNALAGLAVGAAGWAFIWVKGRLASPKGLIQSLGASDPTAVKDALQQATVPDQSAVIRAVNDAQNGVKVVPAGAPVPSVNSPISGPSK